MSLGAKIRYQFMVNLTGRAALAFSRQRAEKRLRSGEARPPYGRPLKSSARLKELISRHYLCGRYARGARPVAWVTSGAPVEFLLALGFHLHYPENHGAVCGIRRRAEELCRLAESQGFSPHLCSYARTDFGLVAGGRSPAGRISPPDFLLCCNNICQTVLYWYQVLAHKFRVPLVVIDTPFLYQPAEEHQIDYVKKQLEQAIEPAEKAAGRRLRFSELQRVARLSKEAVELWGRVLATARRRPAPFLAFDAFIHMAPIVEMRGETFTVDYYRQLLEELEERAQAGQGALLEERYRLVWDNLPIWFSMRKLADWLAERGVALVASTYTTAWSELEPLMDPERPLESGARVYLHALLNRSTGEKLRAMEKLARDFSADGVILHSDRSCKPYSLGQMDQRLRLAGKLKTPALLLEADHNDPRAWDENQAFKRLESFLELLDKR